MPRRYVPATKPAGHPVGCRAHHAGRPGRPAWWARQPTGCPAGFVAGTYLRGIPWVAVPTTLVGQVDAAIGGKTAVNLPDGKNLVGVFHWPSRVAADPTLLETLPAREWHEGMAELIKTGL